MTIVKWINETLTISIIDPERRIQTKHFDACSLFVHIISAQNGIDVYAWKFICNLFLIMITN